MSKEVIHIYGQDIVVGEDSAKTFRGINWATISILVFAAITAVLVVVLFFAGSVIERKNGNLSGGTNTEAR